MLLHQCDVCGQIFDRSAPLSISTGDSGHLKAANRTTGVYLTVKISASSIASSHCDVCEKCVRDIVAPALLSVKLTDLADLFK